MNSKPNFLYLLLLSLSLLVSCKKDSSNEKDNSNDDGHPSVLVFSDIVNAPSIKEIRDDGSIVLNGDSLNDRLTVGSIICSAPIPNAPYGFFYKIKGIKVDKNATIIETEDASLEEVIKEGDASGSLSLTDFIDCITDEEDNKISFEFTESTRTDVSNSVKFPFSIKKEAGGVEYALTGKVELKGDLHYDMSFSDWTLQKFELWQQATFITNVSVNAKASAKETLWKTTLFYISLQPITVIVFGIPVVIVPTIQVRLESSIDGSVKIGCELFDFDCKYKAGVQYHYNSGWDLISDFDYSNPKLFKKWDYFEMKGGIQVGIESSLFPAFYNIRSEKNRLDINVSAPIRLEVSDVGALDFFDGFINPRIKVTLGANVGARGKLNILSKKIVNFEPKATLYEAVLLDKHLYPQFSLSRIDDSDYSLTNLYFSIDNIADCFFSDLTDYGVYLRSGNWLTNDKDGTEASVSCGEIDLEAEMVTSNSNIHNFLVSFSGLVADQTYTVRPYFVDALFNKEHIANAFEFTTKMPGNEDEIRNKLIEFYNDTDGGHWKRDDNWCSDKPIEQWHGISKETGGLYSINLDSNGLSGDASLSMCSWLKYIDVDHNSLTSLDVSGCSELMDVSCIQNDLSSLNAKGCVNLMQLQYRWNNLSSLDISGCAALERIYDGDNHLTSLNMSGCVLLKEIPLMEGDNYTLNASGCTSLESLFLGDHTESVNLSECTSLHYIYLRGFQASVLDLSGCTALKELHFHETHLDSLDVSDCIALPSLSTDDVMFVNASGCTSLQGVSVSSQLKSLDLSRCTALELLDSFDTGGQLMSLNVSGCTSLRGIMCASNQLTTLDVSGCVALESLTCGFNQLVSLDVSGLTKLMALSCHDNRLIAIDLTGCASLGLIDCSNNQLPSLDLTGCVDLCDFDCSDNQLSSLDLTRNTEIEYLDCGNNHLSSLDVSKCTALRYLYCQNNRIVQQINNEDECDVFSYDVLYDYVDIVNNDGSMTVKVTRHNYGWYYPGEPEKGYHGR